MKDDYLPQFGHDATAIIALADELQARPDPALLDDLTARLGRLRTLAFNSDMTRREQRCDAVNAAYIGAQHIHGLQDAHFKERLQNIQVHLRDALKPT